MSRMCREGHLERIIPGVYLGARHAHRALTEAAAWSLKHEQAVACLLTTAVFLDLTDAFAQGTWLYVPKGASPPRSRVVPVRAIQASPKDVARGHDEENGIREQVVHSVPVRFTGPDRTTIDLWRYPGRIPAEHALEALRRRARADDFDIPAFARLARRLDAWPRLEPVLQGLVLR